MSTAKKKAKVNRKFIYIAVGIVLVLVLAYLRFFVDFNRVTLQTVTSYSVENTYDIDAFVVRAESYLSCSAADSVTPLFEDGTRVAKGDKVAVVCNSIEEAANYSEIFAAEKDLERFTQLESAANQNMVDVDLLGTQVSELFVKMLDIVDSGNLSKLDTATDTFLDKGTKLETALNGTTDFSGKIAALTERLNTLRNSTGNIREILSDDTGFYLSKIDGYENAADYNSIVGITTEQLKAAMSKKAELPAANIGKLVTSFKWYITTVMDGAVARNLGIGNSIKIIFPTIGSEGVYATLESVEVDGKGMAAVVFSCLDVNPEFLELRRENAQIVIDTYTGYKVPSSALRNTVDEETTPLRYVYILDKNVVKFVPVEILYNEEDFVLVKISEESDALELYDQVITSGKGLADGKIIYG